jgi:hypothetical protein
VIKDRWKKLAGTRRKRWKIYLLEMVAEWGKFVGIKYGIIPLDQHKNHG